MKNFHNVVLVKIFYTLEKIPFLSEIAENGGIRYNTLCHDKKYKGRFV